MNARVASVSEYEGYGLRVDLFHVPGHGVEIPEATIRMTLAEFKDATGISENPSVGATFLMKLMPTYEPIPDPQ